MNTSSIYSLAAALLLSTVTFSAVADDTTGENTTALPPLVVTATRSPQAQVQLPAALVVINAEEIQESGAQDVAEILSGRAGINTISFGDGSSGSLSMRGSGEASGANVLVLVDGRRLNNTDLAAPDLRTIAVEDIERIEILSGSAGVLYGDQAVAGVVNIITRHPESMRLVLKTEFGNQDRRGIQAALSQQFDMGFFYRGSAQEQRADNYRDHNESEYQNYLLRLGYEWGSGQVYVDGQQTNDRRNTPGALLEAEAAANPRQSLSAFRNDFIDLDTELGRLVVEQELGLGLAVSAEGSWREMESDSTQSFRSGSSSTVTSERQQMLFTPRLTGEWGMSTGDLLLTLGSDYLQEDYEFRSVSSFGPFTQGGDYHRTDFYTQLVLPVMRGLSVTTGVRRAELDNRLSGPVPAGQNRQQETVTAKELGLQYRMANAWRFFLRWDEPFRFSKTDENTNIFGATTLLKTQTGDSWEAGFQWTKSGLDITTTLYRLELNNEIIYDGTNFRNVNLDETRRDGVTLDAHWTVARWLELGLGASFVDATIKANGNKRIPMVAERSGRVFVGLQPTPHWQLNTELQVVGDRPHSGDFDNSSKNLEGYEILNSHLLWSWNAIQAGLRVNNITDKQYAEFGAESFAGLSRNPLPQRNFWVTFGYQIDFQE